MAYVLNPEDDEVKEAPTGPMTRVSSPIGSPQPQPAGVGAGPQTGGGGFVNFDQILAANKTGAENMANKVNTSVVNQAKDAQGAIQGAQTTHSKDVSAGSTTYKSPTIATQASTGNASGVYAAIPTTTATSTAGTASRGSGMLPPPQAAPDVLDRATANDRANATYTGPDGLGDARYDYAGLSKQVQDAQASVTGLGTAGGLQTILQNEYKAAPYTSGQMGFDAALAGHVGGERFKQTQNQYAGLDKTLAAANAQATAQAAAARTGTAAAAAKYGAMVSKYDTDQKAHADYEATAAAQRKDDETAAGVSKAIDEFAATNENFRWHRQNDPEGYNEKVRQFIVSRFGQEAYDAWARSNSRKTSAVAQTASSGAVGGTK